MANKIGVDQLGAAIQQELTIYTDSVVRAVDAESEKAVKELVTKTKASAPVGYRGSFRKSITSKLLKRTNRGSTYVWYVKAPDHRLTHLLVRGHAKKNGGRTRGNAFLQTALDEVLPAYEAKIKEAIRGGRS